MIDPRPPEIEAVNAEARIGSGFQNPPSTGRILLLAALSPNALSSTRCFLLMKRGLITLAKRSPS